MSRLSDSKKRFASPRLGKRWTKRLRCACVISTFGLRKEPLTTEPFLRQLSCLLRAGEAVTGGDGEMARRGRTANLKVETSHFQQHPTSHLLQPTHPSALRALELTLLLLRPAARPLVIGH